MSEHRLKTHRQPYLAVKEGVKRFEFRRDDRGGFLVNDTLVLCEFDEEANAFTGDETRVTVDYVLRAGFGVPDEYVVMSISPVAPAAPPASQVQPAPDYERGVEEGRRQGLEEAAKAATAAGERITDGKAGIEASKDGGAYYVAALLRCLATPSTAAASQVQEREPDDAVYRAGECDGACLSCGECGAASDCAKSSRICGHHCNHSWSHDACCWCGTEWGEDGVETKPPAHPPSAPPGERTGPAKDRCGWAWWKNCTCAMDHGHEGLCVCHCGRSSMRAVPTQAATARKDPTP